MPWYDSLIFFALMAAGLTMWALGTFTDSSLGKMFRALGEMRGPTFFSGILPLWSLGGLIAVPIPILGDLGVYETLPGKILLGGLSLVLAACILTGLVLHFVASLPEWAYPEYHAARRHARQNVLPHTKQIPEIIVINTLDHTTPPNGPTDDTPTGTATVRITRPKRRPLELPRRIRLYINDHHVATITPGQTRHFTIPTTSWIDATLDWCRANTTIIHTTASTTIDLTLTEGPIDEKLTKPDTYLRLRPTTLPYEPHALDPTITDTHPSD